MAGCFGNHPFDRAMEQQLNQYLDSMDDEGCYCYSCEECIPDDDLVWYNDTPVCPHCESKLEL